MSLVKWEPMREMEELFDRLTKSFGPLRLSGGDGLPGADWSPRVDIAETAQAFVVKAEIPEVNKEDVHVALQDGVLTLWGERKQEKEEQDHKFHRIERSFGHFARSFTLPGNVDENGIKAAYRDGVLTVELPKGPEPRADAKEVKVE